MEGEQSAWLFLRRFLAGYASGIGLVLVGHPFDTVKTRLQAEGLHGRFKGPLDCLQLTIKNEGLRGLYKGMAAPLLMTGTVNSVLFGLQFNMAHFIKDPMSSRPSTEDHMKASVVCGMMIATLVAPMEGVKARLQMQYSSAQKLGSIIYTGPLDCARKLISNLGWRHGLYRGFVPVMFCRMSNYSYFGSYAFFSNAFAHTDDQGRQTTSKPATIVSGGLAGITYWLSCYPLDVIKARMQAAPDVSPPLYKGFLHAARTIYKTEGLKAFGAGFVPCALRAFPANAAAFLCFEASLSVLPEKLNF
eukprot:g76614.t1